MQSVILNRLNYERRKSLCISQFMIYIYICTYRPTLELNQIILTSWLARVTAYHSTVNHKQNNLKYSTEAQHDDGGNTVWK